MKEVRNSRILRTIPSLLIIVVMCQLLTGSTAGGAQIPFQWKFAIEDIRLEPSGPYTRVYLKDAILPDDTPGIPWLPAKYVTVLVPPGAILTDLKIQAVEEVCVAHDVFVYPVQEPQPVSAPMVPFVAPNPEAYAAEEKTPALVASIEGTHHFHGYILLSIRLNPLRYVPSKRELYLTTHVMADIVYEVGKVSRLDQNIQSRAYREVMQMISNPSDIERFYPLAQTSVPHSGQIQTLSETREQDSSATYLLITSEELAPACQVLVDWRTAEALPGRLVTLEYIYAHYTGVDEQDQIRNCIRDHYENHGTIYVTLGGDDVVVPVRDCYVKKSNDMPTDLYYGGLDGTWDEDGDGIYGEAKEDDADLYPEVWVGRIPVRTAQQATDYITKVIIYESRSPDGFSQTMLLAGDLGMAYASGTDRPAGFLDHDPASFDEIGMVNFYRNEVQPYWQATPVHKLIDTISSWDHIRCGDYDFTPGHLAERLSWGYHHVWLSAHGGKTKYGSERGIFKPIDALALTNSERLSIIYGEGCTTGAFHRAEPCISEAFLRCPQGGAVVYIGCSGKNYRAHYDLFYREIFVNRRERIGEVFAYYKMGWARQSEADRWTRFVQFGRNLQGDSALRLSGAESVRDLHLSSPHGCEVIGLGSDLTIRWNASGTDFGLDEKVKLEYSADSGHTWHAILHGESLPYYGGVFTWENCPLSAGSNYRVRVSSLADPSVSDMSARDFTVGNLGLLTVQASPIEDVVINVSSDTTDNSNISTDFNITVLEGATVNVSAPLIPEDMSELEFTGWSDEAGNTLSDTRDYIFTFTNDMTIMAEYGEPITQQYYVNDELPENGIAAGDDNNDGDKPQQPMRHIQALLAKYPNLGERSVINISAGTYEENISLDDENAGIVLLGAGQDVTIIDGKQNGSCISLNGCSNGVISGFTIQNGSASRGGGIYCSGSSPKIKECTFVENAAEGKGGAIFTDGSSSPEILDCIFMRNSGKSGGAVCNWGAAAEIRSCLFEANQASRYGGAIHIWSGRGVSQVLDCIFVENTAREYGGAIFLDRSTVPQVSDCIFRDNSARDGGALCNYGGTAEIKSCLFEANHAVGYGGAVDNRHGCSPSFSKCIFYTNEGRSGGAIATIGELDNANVTNCTFSRNNATENGGALYVGYNKCTTATNCILWGNTPGQIIGEASVSYCDVQGGWPGEGNIDADPLFADPDNIDYHLKSQAGRWVPNRQSWVIDNVTSLCIDAGHPYTAVGDEQEPNGNRINMGAYGGTAEASKSP